MERIPWLPDACESFEQSWPLTYQEGRSIFSVFFEASWRYGILVIPRSYFGIYI